jgi:hypothetical protein
MLPMAAATIPITATKIVACWGVSHLVFFPVSSLSLRSSSRCFRSSSRVPEVGPVGPKRHWMGCAARRLLGLRATATRGAFAVQSGQVARLSWLLSSARGETICAVIGSVLVASSATRRGASAKIGSPSRHRHSTCTRQRCVHVGTHSLSSEPR